MTLRLCIPKVIGRGAGLGNELVPWCRSFLASQIVGARSVPPAFGLNPRRYGQHFDTRSWDWLVHRAAAGVLPTFEFTERDYLASGCDDVTEAIRAYAERHDLFARRAFVLTTGGMWGGIRHIAAAREFVRSTLYGSRYAARNLLMLRRRIDASRPVVAIHVRMGDFDASLSPTEYRNRFNASLPISWYRRVAESIYRQCGGAVQFLVVSDGAPEALAELTNDLPCVLTFDIPQSDCSDLLALADADLLVCSVSSFSIWAAFLAEASYLWFEPNLNVHAEGYYSVWGHEPNQLTAQGATRRAIASWQTGNQRVGRGRPVDMDGEVAHDIVEGLRALHARRQPEADLLRYGVVPTRRTPTPHFHPAHHSETRRTPTET